MYCGYVVCFAFVVFVFVCCCVLCFLLFICLGCLFCCWLAYGCFGFALRGWFVGVLVLWVCLCYLACLFAAERLLLFGLCVVIGLCFGLFVWCLLCLQCLRCWMICVGLYCVYLFG